jgi:hypothetical protein
LWKCSAKTELFPSRYPERDGLPVFYGGLLFAHARERSRTRTVEKGRSLTARGMTRKKTPPRGLLFGVIDYE